MKSTTLSKPPIIFVQSDEEKIKFYCPDTGCGVTAGYSRFISLKYTKSGKKNFVFEINSPEGHYNQNYFKEMYQKEFESQINMIVLGLSTVVFLIFSRKIIK